MSNRIRFPQYLTSPYQILWWEIDIWLTFMGAIMLMFLLTGWWWDILLLAFPLNYMKFKKKHPHGGAIHLIYSWRLHHFEGYPSTFENNFRE